MSTRKCSLTVSAAIAAIAPWMAVVGLPDVVMAAEHPDLNGFWEPRAGSIQNRSTPSFTAAGEAEMKKPNKLNDPNGVDPVNIYCLPLGQPWDLYQSAPLDIIQDARETTITYENHSLPWHIYTDGRPHPDAAHLKPTLNGNSIGEWQGDEFVVDSVGFSSLPGHGAVTVIPNNKTTHVIERFRLSADRKELHGHFIIEDPQWLTKPDQFDVVWYRNPPSEYAIPNVCDARNAANAHY
jgi:hypothetical protein